MKRVWMLFVCVAYGGCAQPDTVYVFSEAITLVASENHIFALRPAISDPSQVEFLWAREHRDPEPVPTILEGRTMDVAVLPADDYGPPLLLLTDSLSNLSSSVARLPLAECEPMRKFKPPCRLQRGEIQWNLLSN